MKFNFMFKAVLLILLFKNSNYCSDHSFSFTVELNETAVNRALQQQYNLVGFPTVVTGSTQVLGQTVTYTLHLDLPSVVFSDNNLKIQMKIDAQTSLGNFTNLVIQPSVSIPQSSISTSQVTAFLTNLPDKVQLIPGISQWLKDVIIAAYNSFEPWIYPSKLIANLSTPFLKQRGVDIDEREGKGIVLGWSVSSGVLKLIITTNVVSALPNFSVAMDVIEGNQYPDYFGVLSNIEIQVVEIIIEWGGEIKWHGYPNIVCPKNEHTWIDMGDIFRGSSYIAKVFYKIDETFYVRQYSDIPFIYTGVWYGPVNKLNE